MSKMFEIRNRVTCPACGKQVLLRLNGRLFRHCWTGVSDCHASGLTLEEAKSKPTKEEG